MITLHQFPTAFNVPNLSAFCVKTEAWLKLSGLNFEVETVYDPRQGPKNKLPYIEDDGETIGDSSIIIKHLSEKYNVKIGPKLSNEESAISHSFQSMIEERLYWCIVYSRWVEEENWKKVKEIFFGGMPAILKSIIPNIARKTAISNLYSQGIGRHDREEIYAFAEQDVKAISDYLGAKRYFHGNELSEIDLCIYATVLNMRVDEFESPLKGMIKKYNNLNDHCDRVAEYIEFSYKKQKIAA